MFYLIISIIVITFVLYKRYFPVFGVGWIPLNDLKLDNIKIIDLRDQLLKEEYEWITMIK